MSQLKKMNEFRDRFKNNLEANIHHMQVTETLREIIEQYCLDDEQFPIADSVVHEAVHLTGWNNG